MTGPAELLASPYLEPRPAHVRIVEAVVTLARGHGLHVPGQLFVSTDRALANNDAWRAAVAFDRAGSGGPRLLVVSLRNAPECRFAGLTQFIPSHGFLVVLNQHGPWPVRTLCHELGHVHCIASGGPVSGQDAEEEAERIAGELLHAGANRFADDWP